MKKTKNIKFQLYVPGSTRDFGLGEGVIAEQVARYKETDRPLEGSMFEMSLYHEGQRFLAQEIKVRVTECQAERKPRRRK